MRHEVLTRSLQMRIWLLFLMVFSLVLSGSALAGGTEGRLVEVSGNVWTQAPGDEEVHARAGSTMVPGTLIRTGADGKAEVIFEDGSSVIIRSNTSLKLSGIKRQRKKTSILIFFGRIWNKVSRALGDRAAYEVNTPVLVAGVRGTAFETAVGDDGSVRIRVTDGTVAVAGDGHTYEQALKPGQEVEAGIEGIGRSGSADEDVDWEKWNAQKREHLRQQGRSLVDNVKERILFRKKKLEALRAQQKEIESQRNTAISHARAGDLEAIEEIRRYNEALVRIADEIADLGDAAGSQFGMVDHFSELAMDPRFQMIDGKYVTAEAERMQRIKAMFDEMITEGTDISMAAMEKMLQEMSDGQKGSLKFPKGSSAEDLWGNENKDKKP